MPDSFAGKVLLSRPWFFQL